MKYLTAIIFVIRFGHLAVCLGPKIVVIGGMSEVNDGQPICSIECYCTDRLTWIDGIEECAGCNFDNTSAAVVISSYTDDE